MIRQTASLAGILLLTGCMMVGRDGFETEVARVGDTYVLANLELISLINTHKTLGDHVVGWISGMDCSTPRLERGDEYCMQRPGPPAPPQQVYCYSSLGRPSCYAQPYGEGNDRLIGFVPASAPLR